MFTALVATVCQQQIYSVFVQLLHEGWWCDEGACRVTDSKKLYDYSHATINNQHEPNPLGAC